jgi:hypothetical protein
MQHLKTLFFLVCCFVVGYFIMRGILQFRRHTTDVFETPHTGIGNAPKMRGFTLPLNDTTPSLFDSLPAAKLHATAIALPYPMIGNASDALTQATARAHKHGLQVLLLPPPVFSKNNPYRQPIPAIAQQAQTANVDALCLSWLNTDPDPEFWKRLAAEVRQIFKGKLILAATPEVLVAIESFDGFDEIAAIGPVTLSQRLPHAADDVDLHALRVSWACSLDALESYALKMDKHLMLLNMSVPSTIRAKLAASRGELAPTPNPALQALAYEALIVETKGRTCIDGLFLPWSPQNSDPIGTPSELDAVNHFPALLKKVEELWSPTSALPAPPTPPASETEPDPDEPPL